MKNLINFISFSVIIFLSQNISQASAIWKAKDIKSGGGHICAIDTQNSLRCWGSNDHGQLGDGTTYDSTIPSIGISFPEGISSFALGKSHTCVLLKNGVVKCWGGNDSGQLGNELKEDILLPSNALELASNVKAISISGTYSCALLTSEELYCWGYTLDIPSEKVIFINVGPDSSSCVILFSGKVKCWGSNSYGQLGNGTRNNSKNPIEVIGLPRDVISIVSGDYHKCALTKSGAVKCWGKNDDGQLGDDSNNTRFHPVEVTGLSSGVLAIYAGGDHTCAMLKSGLIKCWGSNNFGELGNGNKQSSNIPVNFNLFPTNIIKYFMAGINNSCAILNSGIIKCWGRNLGECSGEGIESIKPLSVFGTEKINNNWKAIEISTGDEHSCAITDIGEIKCWGKNSRGKFIQSDNDNYYCPVSISNSKFMPKSISVGGESSCILTQNNGVKCWGNGYETIRNGTLKISFTPIDVAGLSNGVKSVAVGYGHACAILVDGKVKCWGNNSYGQLGNGSEKDSSVPVNVNNISNGVKQIAVGDSYTCALFESGNVKCWGEGRCLGFKTQENIINNPVDIPGLENGVVSIKSSFIGKTCALLNTGNVKCWGNSLAVTEEANFESSKVIDIATERFSSCALLESGKVKCWGSNSDGQLGDGTNSDSETPVDLKYLNEPIKNISCGSKYCCALSNKGSIQCWGYNLDGQLGSSKYNRIIPFPIYVFGSEK